MYIFVLVYFISFKLLPSWAEGGALKCANIILCVCLFLVSSSIYYIFVH